MDAKTSERIRLSRVKPLRGAEGALDSLIRSEETPSIAIDGAPHRDF